MKVKRLDERDCLICENPTRKIRSIFCNRCLRPGPFEPSAMTDAILLGNETILALINAYDRTGHPNTLKPLTDRIITLLLSNSTFFKPDRSDALFVAIIRKIMSHHPNHAIVSRGRHHLPHTELVRCPPQDCSIQALCLMTH